MPQDIQRANASLWYNKFCFTWEIEYDANKGKWKDTSKKKYKTQWLNKADGQIAGDADLLCEVRARMQRLVEKKQGSILYMKLTSRLAIGLGNPNPTENGFTFHHIYGAPYVPSSSIKGMVRAWATNWLKVDQKKINRIFGPEDTKEIGKILFLDALPVAPLKLEKELINVLYGDYYRKGSFPIDSYSPNLIPFLTVAAGQTFYFSIIPRKFYDGVEDDMKDVKSWLIQALQWLGLGAKTSNGYGRFIENPDYDGEMGSNMPKP